MNQKYGDCTKEFMEALAAQSKLQKSRCNDITVIHAKNRSRAKVMLDLSSKLLKDFEVIPESLKSPDVSFIRVSRATPETVVTLDRREHPVEKVTLEINVSTGHATLRIE